MTSRYAATRCPEIDRRCRRRARSVHSLRALTRAEIFRITDAIGGSRVLDGGDKSDMTRRRSRAVARRPADHIRAFACRPSQGRSRRHAGELAVQTSRLSARATGSFSACRSSGVPMQQGPHYQQHRSCNSPPRSRTTRRRNTRRRRRPPPSVTRGLAGRPIASRPT